MNLTQEQRIVSEERSGVGPKPGHDLAVFEVADHGTKFDRVVADNTPFEPRRKRRFGPLVEYVSYAVNMNRNLSYEFSDRFDHKSGGHAFDLTFTLRFHVKSAGQLVLRLNDDPLWMVREEAKRVFGGAVAALSWPEIAGGKQDDNFRAQSQAQNTKHLAALREIADDLGLDVKAVDLMVGFTAADVEPLAAKADTERKILIAQAEDDLADHNRQRTVVNQRGDLEAEIIVLGPQHQRDVIKQMNANEITALEAEGRMINRGADEVITAIHNAAEDIRNADTLVRSMETVRRAFTAMRADRQLTSGQSPDTVLTGGKPGPGLESVLVDVFTHFGELARGAQAQRRFLSAIVHWVAELTLRSEADQQILDHYRKILEVPLDDITDGQHQLLRQLLREDDMKVRLA